MLYLTKTQPYIPFWAYPHALICTGTWCPYIQHTSSGIMVPMHLLKLMALCLPLHCLPLWLHAPPVRGNPTCGDPLHCSGKVDISSFNSLVATILGSKQGGIKVNCQSQVQFTQVRFSLHAFGRCNFQCRLSVGPTSGSVSSVRFTFSSCSHALDRHSALSVGAAFNGLVCLARLHI